MYSFMAEWTTMAQFLAEPCLDGRRQAGKHMDARRHGSPRREIPHGQEQEACTAAGVSGARRSGGGVQRRGAAAALALTADAAPDSVSRKEEKQREG
uniref:Uncharacterized protein n=1 Tax=Oryza rufipogon TaxID=4529 RepID=A0A0E0QEB3_ORYRU